MGVSKVFGLVWTPSRGQYRYIVPALPPGVVRVQCAGVLQIHCGGSGYIVGVVRVQCGGTAFCLTNDSNKNWGLKMGYYLCNCGEKCDIRATVAVN